MVQSKWDMRLAMGDLTFLQRQTNDANLGQFVRRYMNTISNIKSDKAVLTAEGILERFREHLGSRSISNLEEVTHRIVQDYIDGIHRAVKTKRNHAQEIKLLFDEAIREGIILNNPAKLIRFPKSDRKIRHRVLDPEDFRIIKAEGEPWLLYYLILYFTGLRAGDAAMLKFGDFDRLEGVMTCLIRNSGKIYEMPLSEHLLRALPTDGAADAPLFPHLYEEDDFKRNNRYREPREHLQTVLADHDRPKATLHSFRVTFNNRLRDLGLSIEDRQKLLAHSSSETTKIYTHPNVERARDYINKLTNPFEPENEV